jgi:hypothetical protein
MMKKLGNCPYCNNGQLEVREIKIQGKKTKLYACSNAHWSKEFDVAELTAESTCSFRIFSNQLLRWNKRSLGTREIQTLLAEEQVKVRLFSSRTKTEYFKWIILDKEYGVSVLWDIDITDEEENDKNEIYLHE